MAEPPAGGDPCSGAARRIKKPQGLERLWPKMNKNRGRSESLGQALLTSQEARVKLLHEECTKIWVRM